MPEPSFLFLSALSDQLWGHDLSHAWLRREICAYLLAHRERCENFVDADGGFDKYIRDMQTTGTYGGHLELQVCAWLMRVNIKVIQPTVRHPVRVSGRPRQSS